jgi:hypothetical protein|tara:strand:+ start:40 stop:258 length:219 start_codon:yes stop_codon:yes gene_type:complete
MEDNISLSQKNHDEILMMKGELKLIKNEIKNIKDNHLAHLDYKISQIQKILWVVFTGVLANLLWIIKTMLVG